MNYAKACYSLPRYVHIRMRLYLTAAEIRARAVELDSRIVEICSRSVVLPFIHAPLPALHSKHGSIYDAAAESIHAYAIEQVCAVFDVKLTCHFLQSRVDRDIQNLRPKQVLESMQQHAVERTYRQGIRNVPKAQLFLKLNNSEGTCEGREGGRRGGQGDSLDHEQDGGGSRWGDFQTRGGVPIQHEGAE